MVLAGHKGDPSVGHLVTRPLLWVTKVTSDGHFCFIFLFFCNNNNMTHGLQGGWVRSIDEPMGQKFLFIFYLFVYF
jgi:hypothetical protein